MGTRLVEQYPEDVAEVRMQRGRDVLMSGEPCSFEDRIGDRGYLSTISPVKTNSGEVTQTARRRACPVR